MWIICDLDGTLCDHSARHHLAADKDTRGQYHDRCYEDSPEVAIKLLIIELHNVGHKIAFITGRPESHREETERWLKWCFPSPLFTYELHMKPTGDERGDVEFKSQVYEDRFRKRGVWFVLEDRKRVVDMWRSKGLMTFQVAEGDF